jgi:signal transduction histidine kinase/GAF domain-containing protein
MIAGPRFGDYRQGFQFGRLGYDLVEKRRLHRFQARTYMSFGNLVMPWTRHVRTGRDLVRRAFDVANEMGDLTFAAYSCNNLNTNRIAAGDPLGDVQREAENGLDFARNARFGLVIDIIKTQIGLVRTLRGLTPIFGSFDDAGFNEVQFERHLASDPRLALPECWYWIRKLQARFFAAEYSSATEASLNAQRLLWTSPSFFEVAEYEFYSALSWAAQCGFAQAEYSRPQFEALTAHHRQLEDWASNCPENFETRASLVSAEIARIEGRELDAMRLYERAIRSARENGFIHNEALAHELAGRFMLERDFETAGYAHLRDARDCFAQWGADGKVTQLEHLWPRLTAGGHHRSGASGSTAQQLDAVTVVKASQALSGEIVLDNLIKTLMVIAVEHAGAERGVLVLPRGDELWVAAEATTGLATVEVDLRQTLVVPSDLPDSVLRYVIRTQEPVILEDASRQGLFSADSYIVQKHARSVLCLPLIKQTQLVGVLYVENNLAASVFTSDRIAVLKLLSSQAAISLENARLYAELINENRDRQKAEAALRRSEASLTEAQQISHTGNWRWKVGAGEVTASEELLRIFAFDPTAPRMSYAAFIGRVHGEDRLSLEQALHQAVREGHRFQLEYRIILPDGSIKYLYSAGRPDAAESGEPEFVGAVMDITERRRAEEALRNAQAELAHITRLTTMGELVMSIAHEINQPLAGVIASGNACLRWLDRDKPDLDAARQSVSRIVRDGARASDVIRGLRTLAKKSDPRLTPLDINDTIQEVLALTRTDLRRHGVLLDLTLSTTDRQVLGDRVLLQQVLLNLIMNGIEAMSAVTDHPKVLAIISEPVEAGGMQVAVEDAGTGLDPDTADRIFEPFFTTKSYGMGMGLSICRSIIDAHGGRFWVSPRVPRGTVFRFTVPGVASQK